ncbi:T9SS type A sorting domain-containing protein [Hwangdonia lutea]|uniref:T9SS type A sorting domain-containing protein n=1 Tax=Hwangdonia lutea TaxID=3075823 RepID=A0AA97HRW3_9FLAO|nr:T9SS type A sorting domain-containing protein [Hwangdonia sp. SCSIO 19198]WOD43908.1 T9SS type A sorting domain-containing protein [Hwangdonia sp. SCSIO 19198]
MKKNYFILLLISVFSFSLAYAEPCPNGGGTTSSGGTKIFLSYLPATSFCVNRPNTIEVNGTTTFTLEVASCSETTSVYNLTSGPAIVGQDFTITSGFDSNCSYSGGTLPVDKYILETSLEVSPNPLKSDNTLKLSFAFPVKANISVYNITGKRVIQDNISNQENKELNIANLPNGIYILNIATKSATAVRKLVVAR